MLLVGTGLGLRSLWSLRNISLGFAPDHLLTFRVAAPSQLTGPRISDFYHDVIERVRALPGLESAAVARDFPLSGTDPSTAIETEGKTPAPVQGEIVTRYRAVSEGYFRTLEIPVLQGRTFDERDTASSSPVALGHMPPTCWPQALYCTATLTKLGNEHSQQRVDIFPSELSRSNCSHPSVPPI